MLLHRDAQLERFCVLLLRYIHEFSHNYWFDLDFECVVEDNLGENVVDQRVLMLKHQLEYFLMHPSREEFSLSAEAAGHLEFLSTSILHLLENQNKNEEVAHFQSSFNQLFSLQNPPAL